MSEICSDCLGDGCDITMCHDCGEEYTDPCAYHRSHGHVPSFDGYTDGVECDCVCRSCGAKAKP